MKSLSVVVFVLACGLCISPWIAAGVWSQWWYPRTYEYALRLADDASTPELKMKYLREYRERVSTITGEPRWFFTRPDWDTKKQLSILDSLIKRFDDLQKIEPSSFAYQQGMQQLSGQEIDHQLSHISRIFKAAKWRESPVFFVFCLWGSLLFWIFPLAAGIWMCVEMDL